MPRSRSRSSAIRFERQNWCLKAGRVREAMGVVHELDIQKYVGSLGKNRPEQRHQLRGQDTAVEGQEGTRD